jgi:hypothetical protein
MTLAALLVMAFIVTAAATPGPGPGEPFGGDDAGCVPAGRAERQCGDTIGKAVARLIAEVMKCHVKQADARFSTVVAGSPRSFDEEACETNARAKLDRTLATVGANGLCTGVALAAATTHADMLLAGASEPSSLDALNGVLYCDPTTGVAIDPAGEDAGTVPSSAAPLKCGDQLARRLATLEGDVIKCHAKAAKLGLALADPSFDEEGCEAKAVAKLDRASAGLVAKGLCPPCLDAAAQHALGSEAVARRDGGNGAIAACPDVVLHPGTVEIDRPTLITLGVRWLISGDADHDAAVGVRYRPVGDLVWRDGLPGYRVRPETVDGRSVPEQFAGSIFDLRPATSYEIELHATDADGAVDETRTVTATTRGVPADPVTPNVRPVGDVAGLNAALANAAPGDVITLADGVYAGLFVLAASGTAANPIVVRGASTSGTILDGGDCTGCNVLEVYGSFVHVERLTLRNATRALRFQTAGAEGNVVRRVRITDVTLGIGSRENQRDFYLCDNVLEGRLVWPHIYRDDGGAFSDDDGIHVEGDGHVVCHNQIVGFGDAMKTEQVGARAVEFYGNEVLSAYDNGVELDVSEGNCRAFRNRFTNTYSPISFQPIYGGPAYAFRNVVVNIADEQMKFHGLGSGSGPSGVLAYHNTFVSPAIALEVATNATSHHFGVENNLFVGPALLAGTRTVDWTAPIDAGHFDWDGYFPNGGFRFNLPPAGLVSFPDFAALQAGGLETNGVLLTQPIFASGLTAPASYAVTMAPQDVTLDATSNALDHGRVLPNVNDGFMGAAPDLGALERGCPLPIFGVRPDGIDERNEPFGCVP